MIEAKITEMEAKIAECQREIDICKKFLAIFPTPIAWTRHVHHVQHLQKMVEMHPGLEIVKSWIKEDPEFLEWIYSPMYIRT